MTRFIEEHNRIYMKNDAGEMIAEITFPDIDAQTVNINHTYVDGSLRGKGIASELVKAVAEKIRAEKKKIIPTCSYAVTWFEKHTEYNDLL